MPKVTKEPTEGTRKSSRTTSAPASSSSAAASKPETKKRSPPTFKAAPAEKSKAVEDKEEDKMASSSKSAALAKIELGSTLPELTLQNEQGEDVDVSKLAGDKGLVIFVYPKANTPGCTTQACNYRDAKTDITDLGYTIIGLSKDKPAAQLSWITKQKLTYSLLSDPSSKLLNALGASKRSHFVFEKGTGKMVDQAIGVKPADDVENVLEFIKKHHA